MNKLLTILLLFPACLLANNHVTDTIGHKEIKKITVTTTTVISEQDLGPFKLSNTETKTDTVVEDIKEAIVLSTEPFQEPAKPKYWKLGSDFNVGFSQVAFFNWFSGGTNASSFSFTNKSFAYYEKDLSLWKTDFELNYGIQQRAEERWFKNKDIVNLESIYGFRASKNWYYSALLKFKSQLSKGYENPSDSRDKYISRLFSPAYSTFSIGMEYNNDKKNLSIYLSPMAYELTFVTDTALSVKYLKEPNIYHLASFGPMGSLKYNEKLGKNIEFNTQIDVLADVLKMKEPFVKVDWKFEFSYRMTRYLRLGIKTNLVYDPKALFDVLDSDGNATGQKKRKVQFTEQIMLNFTYRIRND